MSFCLFIVITEGCFISLMRQGKVEINENDTNQSNFGVLISGVAS